MAYLKTKTGTVLTRESNSRNLQGGSPESETGRDVGK
jgi:hypothetical protein